MPGSTTTENGAFDIVGDVHGCLAELLELMAALGYRVERPEGGFAVTPPQGRRLAFVGDLVNRGPATAEVLRLAASMVKAGQALSVAGNHDLRLLTALRGGALKMTPDLAESLEQLARGPRKLRAGAARFLGRLPSQLVLDGGRLAIAHAGLRKWTKKSGSGEARAQALRGETGSEPAAPGMPAGVSWATDYGGAALVVFGHSPVAEPRWLNNTVDIDTGCVYGGWLTALRYPERETVSVPARAVYYRSRKPFLPHQALAKKPKRPGPG